MPGASAALQTTHLNKPGRAECWHSLLLFEWGYNESCLWRQQRDRGWRILDWWAHWTGRLVSWVRSIFVRCRELRKIYYCRKFHSLTRHITNLFIFSHTLTQHSKVLIHENILPLVWGLYIYINIYGYFVTDRLSSIIFRPVQGRRYCYNFTKLVISWLSVRLHKMYF